MACVPLVLDGAPPVILCVAEARGRADRPFDDSEPFDPQELVARTSHHVDRPVTCNFTMHTTQ